MFLSQSPVRAFEADFWRDYPAIVERWAARLAADPAGFDVEADRAWAIRDTKAVAAAADAMDRSGALTATAGERAGVTLLLHNRPADALRMLTHPAVAARPAPKTAYYVARALAACGRLIGALGAAEDALAMRSDFAAAVTLMRTLARTLRLQVLVEARSDWSDVRGLMAAYAELRAETSAAALVQQALSIPPAASPKAREDMIAVLEAGLELAADRDAAERLVTAALALAPADPRLLALRIACQVLNGRAETARTIAPTPGVGDDRALRCNLALAAEAAGDLPSACEQLGRLSADHVEDQDIRHALAHAVGADVLASVKFRPRARRRRRIVNLFPFCDELTLLNLRLHEMADWVDHFVLIEARETFVGAPKPLHYQENQGDFAAFGAKIVPLAIDAFPPHINSHWARDFHQRDRAVEALADLCGDDDLVFITDVDEIVDHAAVEGFDGDCARLDMKLFRFFLNYRPMDWNPSRIGRTGAIFKARHLVNNGLSYARFVLSRRHKDQCRIPDAGWHFTSLGQAETIARKYNNYAHQDRVNVYRDETALEALLGAIRAGETERGWERCDLDDSFPRYVLDHQAELASVIL